MQGELRCGCACPAVRRNAHRVTDVSRLCQGHIKSLAGKCSIIERSPAGGGAGRPPSVRPPVRQPPDSADRQGRRSRAEARLPAHKPSARRFPAAPRTSASSVGSSRGSAGRSRTYGGSGACVIPDSRAFDSQSHSDSVYAKSSPAGATAAGAFGVAGRSYECGVRSRSQSQSQSLRGTRAASMAAAAPARASGRASAPSRPTATPGPGNGGSPFTSARPGTSGISPGSGSGPPPTCHGQPTHWHRHA